MGQPQPLPLIYSDARFLAFSKPSGMPSVPGASPLQSALNYALEQFPELAHLPERRAGEPALLHRLDTGTSGVLLFARTPEVFKETIDRWSEIDKRYRAWVVPDPQLSLDDAPHARIISVPLAHSAKSKKRMIPVTRDTHSNLLRGRPLPALTEILTVHDRVQLGQGGHAWELEIAIKTGVMHQIRAHLAHVGWPILGDAVYKGPASSRLHLHAWRICVPWLDPKNGGLWMTAPPPPDFAPPSA